MSQSAELRDFRISGKYYYSEPVYLFLAKKHADLVEKIDAALKDVKRNGAYKRIFGINPA